jgi:hypothetical protein
LLHEVASLLAIHAVVHLVLNIYAQFEKNDSHGGDTELLIIYKENSVFAEILELFETLKKLVKGIILMLLEYFYFYGDFGHADMRISF